MLSLYDKNLRKFNQLSSFTFTDLSKFCGRVLNAVMWRTNVGVVLKRPGRLSFGQSLRPCLPLHRIKNLFGPSKRDSYPGDLFWLIVKVAETKGLPSKKISRRSRRGMLRRIEDESLCLRLAKGMSRLSMAR